MSEAPPFPPPAAPGPVKPRRVLRLPNPMIAMVWVTLFVPGHLFDWWVERGFTASVFLFSSLMIAVKAAPWETRRDAARATMFFFAVQFLYTFSFIYSVAFNGIPTGSRDYFELGRYVFLWAFVVYTIRHYDPRVREATETACTVGLYFSLLVLVCYLRSVPVLTPLLKRLYADTKTFAAYGQVRLSAPFENPNFLGFYTAQVLCYLVFFSRSKMRLAHCAAALFVLFYSGSRTSWAGAAIVMASAAAVYAYLGAARVRLKLVLQLSLATVLLVAAGARFSTVVMRNNRVVRLLKAAQGGGVQEEANAAGRVSQAREVVEFVGRSPVFGWGPSKYATRAYVDNQYLIWALRAGLLGALTLLGGAIWAAARLVLSRRGDAMAFAGTGTFVLAVGVMLMAGAFFDNFRIFFMTWFMGLAMAEDRA